MPSASDQASGLRRLLGKQDMPVVAFVSVRPEFSIGRHDRMSDRVRLMLLFADEFARAGRRVAILDENPPPGGVTSAYGVESRRDIKHVLQGSYGLEEVLLEASPGVAVIPAARAADADLDIAGEAALAGNLRLVKSQHDCVMIDCVYRSQRALSPLASQADHVLLVVAANGDDLMPAYSVIKRLTLEQPAMPVSIIVAHATDAAHARATFDRLREVAFAHLGIHLRYRGAAFTPGVRRPSLMTLAWKGNGFDSGPASITDTGIEGRCMARMGRDSVV